MIYPVLIKIRMLTV